MSRLTTKAKADIAASVTELTQGVEEEEKKKIEMQLKHKKKALDAMKIQIASGKQHLTTLSSLISEKATELNALEKLFNATVDETKDKNTAVPKAQEIADRAEARLQQLESHYHDIHAKGSNEAKISQLEADVGVIDSQLDSARRTISQLERVMILHQKQVSPTASSDGDHATRVAKEKKKTLLLMGASFREKYEAAEELVAKLSPQSNTLHQSINQLKHANEEAQADSQSKANVIGITEISKCLQFSKTSACKADKLDGAARKSSELSTKLGLAEQQIAQRKLNQADAETEAENAKRAVTRASLKVSMSAEIVMQNKAQAVFIAQQLDQIEHEKKATAKKLKAVNEMKESHKENGFDRLKAEARDASFNGQKLDLNQKATDMGTFSRMAQSLANAAESKSSEAQQQMEVSAARLKSVTELHQKASKKQAIAAKERDDEQARLKEAQQAAKDLPEAPQPVLPEKPTAPFSPGIDFDGAAAQNNSILCISWVHDDPAIYRMDDSNRVVREQLKSEYQVSYSTESSGVGWVNHEPLVQQTSVCVTTWGLWPGLEYFFRVRAKTSRGWSDWSSTSLPIAVPPAVWTCPHNKLLKATIRLDGSLCSAQVSLTAVPTEGWASNTIITYASPVVLDDTKLGGGVMVTYEEGEADSRVAPKGTSALCTKGLAKHAPKVFAVALSQRVSRSATHKCPAHEYTEYDAMHRSFVGIVQKEESSRQLRLQKAHEKLWTSAQQLKRELDQFEVPQEEQSASVPYVKKAVKALKAAAPILLTAQNEAQKAVNMSKLDLSGNRTEASWQCSLSSEVQAASIVTLSQGCSSVPALRVRRTSGNLSPECTQELDRVVASRFKALLIEYAHELSRCATLMPAPAAVVKPAARVLATQKYLLKKPSSTWLKQQQNSVKKMSILLEQAIAFTQTDRNKAAQMMMQIGESAGQKVSQIHLLKRVERGKQPAVDDVMGSARKMKAFKWACAGDTSQHAEAHLLDSTSCAAWGAFQAKPLTKLNGTCREDFFVWAAERYGKTMQELAVQLKSCEHIHATPNMFASEAQSTIKSIVASSAGSLLEQQASKWEVRASDTLKEITHIATEAKKRSTKRPVFATAALDEAQVAIKELQVARQQLDTIGVIENRTRSNVWKCDSDKSAIAAVHTARQWSRSAAYGKMPPECKRELVVAAVERMSRLAAQQTDGLVAVPRETDSAVIGLFTTDDVGLQSSLGYFGETPTDKNLKHLVGELMQNAASSARQRIRVAAQQQRAATASAAEEAAQRSGLQELEAKLVELRAAVNSSQIDPEPEADYSDYFAASKPEQITASRVWLVQDDLEEAHVEESTASQADQNLALEEAGDREVNEKDTAAWHQAKREQETNADIASKAQAQAMTAKLQVAEVAVNISQHQEMDHQQQLEHATATVKECKAKLVEQEAKLSSSAAGKQEAIRVKVKEKQAKVDTAKLKRDRLMEQQAEGHQRTSRNEAQVTALKQKLVSFSKSVKDVGNEALIASKELYQKSVKGEKKSRERCEALTKKAFEAEKWADGKARREAQILEDIKASQDQKAILPSIAAGLERKQVELRLKLSKLRAATESFERGERATPPEEGALEAAQSAYKKAKQQAEERRLDAENFDLRIADEKKQLEKAAGTAAQAQTAAKEAKDKAALECENHRKIQESMYSHEQQELAAASAAIKGQAEQQVQAEVALRVCLTTYCC